MSKNNLELKNWVIYKITNPNGGVYIGKTYSFKQRFWQHKSTNGKNQPKLNESYLMYGFDAHKFDILESFLSNHLTAFEREIYWVKEYKSNHIRYPESNGLNLTDGGYGIVGYKRSKESILKVSGKNSWNYGKTGELSPMYGRTGEKSHMYGKTLPLITIGKLRLSSKNRIRGNFKKVINTKTLEVFPCIKDAANSIGIKDKSLRSMLKGVIKNKTDFTYVDR